MFSLCFHTFSYVFRDKPIDKMPSASSLFSAVFGFRKVVLEIFSELDTTKTEVPIFPRSTRKSEGESKTGTRWASPCPGAAPTWPRLGVVRAPWWPPDVALPPI